MPPTRRRTQARVVSGWVISSMGVAMETAMSGSFTLLGPLATGTVRTRIDVPSCASVVCRASSSVPSATALSADVAGIADLPRQVQTSPLAESNWIVGPGNCRWFCVDEQASSASAPRFWFSEPTWLCRSLSIWLRSWSAVMNQHVTATAATAAATAAATSSAIRDRSGSVRSRRTTLLTRRSRPIAARTPHPAPCARAAVRRPPRSCAAGTSRTRPASWRTARSRSPRPP